MSENKFYVYDNGSVASKLLQHEYKDAEVIKVSSSSILEGFTKFDPKKERKILLPFTVEELADNNERIRKDIQAVEAVGFKNLVVLPYEGDTKDEIQKRAKIAGVDSEQKTLKQPTEVLKGEAITNEDDKNKPYKTVTGRDVQAL